MRSAVRNLALLSCTLLLGVSGAPSVKAAAGVPEQGVPQDRPPYCPPDPDGAQVSFSSLPQSVPSAVCELRGAVVVSDAIGASVPDRGDSVYAEALTIDGAESIYLKMEKDGTLLVSTEMAESGPDERAPDTPSACADSAFVDNGVDESNDHQWRFNADSRPNYLDSLPTIEALRSGTSNITHAFNTCDKADTVDAEATYNGITSDKADIKVVVNDGVDTPICKDNTDSHNVVDFFDLGDNGTLAANCNWTSTFNSSEVSETDIRFDRGTRRWTTQPGQASCDNEYDIESVMTHERGHTYGLGHVTETGHGNLTMSRRLNGACQASERSLGFGDWLGFDSKY